jgi:VWFA-related protein
MFHAVFPSTAAHRFAAHNPSGSKFDSPRATESFRRADHSGNVKPVFLDVTVLDKKGRPVVKGLTQNDFTITEGKKPQRIISFEAPEAHVMRAGAGNDNPEGKVPVAIFVLDLLNSSFADFAYIRYEVRQYLVALPPHLDFPAELMVLGNRRLEMQQGYTRNRDDLLYALDHLEPSQPYKLQNGGLAWLYERTAQSYDALQQMVLQNKGVPGRKNIIWVGHGGPGLWTPDFTGHSIIELKRLVRETVNMLVDARISLFVIYPRLEAIPRIRTLRQMDSSIESRALSEMDSELDFGDGDPFASDINFGVLVNETGGKLFYNRNDVAGGFEQSQQMGAEYYTLTYQPPSSNANGKFRRIRVTLRDPNLRAVTKNGYYAPDKSAPVDPRQQTRNALFDAAQSTIPLVALDVKVSSIVQHPDTGTVDLTVQLKAKNIHWLPADKGKSTANLVMAGVSLTGGRSVLASNVLHVILTANTQDPIRLATVVTTLKLTLRVPRKTQSLRVVMATEEEGRIGTADLDRAAIDAAPALPTPEPQLERRPPDQESPHGVQ